MQKKYATPPPGSSTAAHGRKIIALPTHRRRLLHLHLHVAIHTRSTATAHVESQVVVSLAAHPSLALVVAPCAGPVRYTCSAVRTVGSPRSSSIRSTSRVLVR